MLNAFIIVLREGFEAFLIVAIIFSYLRKTGQNALTPVVYAAIVTAIAASAAIGYWLSQATEGSNQALWEGILGLIAVVLVASLIVHMRRIAPKLKQTMHQKLDEATTGRSRLMAMAGVFFFTLLMITREGMETALLLLQIHGQLLAGALLGLAAATLLALAWAKYSHLIDMKRFFQVTNLFLILFLVQIAIYTFHEFAEAEVLPNSEALHAATEILSPDGEYGKWFSMWIVVMCIGWLVVGYVSDRARRSAPTVTNEAN
ncbi:MAG: FTR1 family iron permease [Blastocatellia bacterium]